MPQACAPGGGFSSGHRWGILGGHRGHLMYMLFVNHQVLYFITMEIYGQHLNLISTKPIMRFVLMIFGATLLMMYM